MFHPLSYSNNRDDGKMSSLNNIQLKEFGQTPEQLFIKPHPKKYSNKIIDISITLKNLNEDNSIKNNNIEKKEKNMKNDEKENNNSNISNDIIENKDDKKINNINEEINTSTIENSINQNSNDNIKINEDNKSNNKSEIKENDENNINNNTISSEDNNEDDISNNNNFIKTFPIKSNINFDLNKEYKRVNKFNEKSITSGTILQGINLIIAGAIDGHLNIYDYYSGEITKIFLLSCPINNICSINTMSLIAYSSNCSINIFNTDYGKNIFSYFAQEKEVMNFFFNENNNKIISCSNNGIINVWNIEQKSSFPDNTHFLFDVNKLNYVDYNSETNLFYCLDDSGKISIFDVNENDDNIINFEIEKNYNVNFISCNPKNLNEFILGCDNGFKIFDIRNNSKCVENFSGGEFDMNVKKCILDNEIILMQNENVIKLVDYNSKSVIKEIKPSAKIEFFNIYNLSKGKTRTIYGCENGDLFYSVIKRK